MRDNLLPIWRRKIERGHRGDYGVTSGYCVDVEHQNFELDTTIFKYARLLLLDEADPDLL